MSVLEERNLFRLIETWEENNIELAFQLMEANPLLKTAAQQRYSNVLHYVYKRSDLSGLAGVGTRSIRYFAEQLSWEPSEIDIDVLASLPIERINFTYDNNVTALPYWIFYIKKLTSLKCAGQALTIIPPQIGQLKGLTELDLTNNAITTIPQEIAGAEKLQILNLDHNPVTNIPNKINKLVHLKWLCLEGTQIRTLPQTLLDLKNLEWLSVEKTPLGHKHGITKGRMLSPESSLLKRLVGV